MKNGLELCKVDTFFVYAGDILLTKNQVEILNKQNFNDISIKSAIISNFLNYWSDGIVYYEISSCLKYAYRVKKAIEHWESKTSIRFLPRKGNVKNYVEFVDGSGCASYIGCIGGRQTIILGPQCSVGNTIHEIGHAVGLFHEQSRADRDNHIIINWSNIISGYEHNFKTYLESNYIGRDIGSFDFNSIMIYHSWAFSKNDKPTIIKKDGSVFLSQRVGLSKGDIEGVEAIYGAPYPKLIVEIDDEISDDLEREVKGRFILKFYSDKTYKKEVVLKQTKIVSLKEHRDVCEYVDWYIGVKCFNYKKNQILVIPPGISSLEVGDYYSYSRYNDRYEFYGSENIYLSINW